MRSAFTGAFAPYICGLIEKKQALGYDYHGSACILRTFDEFCREQFPNETCLTAELAMKWAEQFKTEKNLSRLNRVSVIRELAKYMNSVGEQAYHLHRGIRSLSGSLWRGFRCCPRSWNFRCTPGCWAHPGL